MTEQEWLACTDPTPMLDYLRTQRTASERKLRLFCAACCRRVWDWHGEKCRVAIEVLERHVDGAAEPDELFRATVGVNDEWLDHFGHHHPSNAVFVAMPANKSGPALDSASIVAAQIVEAVRCESNEAGDGALSAERATQCHLLRDIFHGPTQPIYFRARWRTDAVTKLASTIYNERKFNDLPVLAAALAQAGCDDKSILDHCRREALHARGCWVLDLVLLKS